jgi:predicted dehydrogenase
VSRIRIGQIGTRHGHAAGKWQALTSNPDVEAVGIWEPDASLRGRNGFAAAEWFSSADELLGDPSVVAVAIEGRNHESLAMAAQAVAAGKHLWFDKPAGDDYPAFERLMSTAIAKQLYVQMGYMFRYSPGFAQVADWARAGMLGDIFAVRAHMSTNVNLTERREQSRHLGGILYDLGGHVLDQIVWLLGRPTRISTVLHNAATPELPSYSDNTVSTLEFGHALAIVDIAAMEPSPTARRFEVYGTHGSAILEPFDPVRTIRLTLVEPVADFAAGEQVLELLEVSRQTLYDRELAAFVPVLRGERSPDRSPEHDLLVQETLLRTTGRIR